MTEGDQQSTLETEGVGKARLFCNHYQLNPELQRAIISHTKYFYHYNYVASSEDEVMQCLPIYLQKQIKHELAKRSLKQIDLFKDLSDEVIGDLVLSMKSVACNAFSKLYHKGDDATQLYIQRVGKSRLYDNDPKKPQFRLNRGNIAGEYCLKEKKRKYTLLCTTWSEFFVLNKTDITQSINKYYNVTEAQNIRSDIDNKLSVQCRIQRTIDFTGNEDADSNRIIPASTPRRANLDIIQTENDLNGIKDENNGSHSNMVNNKMKPKDDDYKQVEEEEELKEIEMTQRSLPDDDGGINQICNKNGVGIEANNSMRSNVGGILNRLIKRREISKPKLQKRKLERHSSELRNDRMLHHYKNLKSDGDDIIEYSESEIDTNQLTIKSDSTLIPKVDQDASNCSK